MFPTVVTLSLIFHGWKKIPQNANIGHLYEVEWHLIFIFFLCFWGSSKVKLPFLSFTSTQKLNKCPFRGFLTTQGLLGANIFRKYTNLIEAESIFSYMSCTVTCCWMVRDFSVGWWVCWKERQLYQLQPAAGLWYTA